MAYQKLLSQIMGHNSAHLNSKRSQIFGTFSMWLQALTFLKLTALRSELFELQNTFSTKMICFWHCSYNEHLPSLNWKLAWQNWPTEESSEQPSLRPQNPSYQSWWTNHPSIPTTTHTVTVNNSTIIVMVRDIFWTCLLVTLSLLNSTDTKVGNREEKSSNQLQNDPIYWKRRKALFSVAIGETFAHYMWMTTIHRCHFQGL